jgi:hypothetical protein
MIMKLTSSGVLSRGYGQPERPFGLASALLGMPRMAAEVPRRRLSRMGV